MTFLRRHANTFARFILRICTDQRNVGYRQAYENTNK